jgi:modulator of FtsH protease HflK
MASENPESTAPPQVVKQANRGVTRLLMNVLLLVISVAVLLGWGSQGVYRLQPGESAVILRLGAYHRTRSVGGLWAHLPPPLESHIVVDTSQVRTEAFGENPTRSTPGMPSDAEEGRVAEGITREAIQTSDHNVVNVTYELQYKIADGYAWAYSMADPADVLHDATESAMRNVIGKREIDEVLSQDRGDIEREAEHLLADMLSKYAQAVGHVAAFGVERINLEKPQAPEEVREAFADVVSAGQDEKRSTLEATGDASEILERARSEAAEIREQAEAYRTTKIVEAKGEAARFESLLVQYQAAPEVTRRRLYLETMEAILPEMDKVIVEKGAVNLWSSWPPAQGAPGAAAASGSGGAAR